MKSSLINFFLFTNFFSGARSIDASRNKNWQPEKGKFYFSEVLSWEFLNENYPPDDDMYFGSFAVYIDPPTGTMLFTPEAYGNSSEMINFVIVFQNGRYLQGYTDEFGRKKYLVDTLHKF